MKSILSSILVLLLTLLLSVFLMGPAQASGFAPSGPYVADPTHTSVIWRISHFGFSHYTARFATTQARLEWDADHPEQSTLHVSIDPSSVRTDFPFPEIKDFDRTIGTDKAYLAGAPITFVSTSIEWTAERAGRVTGDLTFRGQTHSVTLDVIFNGSTDAHRHDKAPRIGFSGKAVIDRERWGLNIHAPDIGAQVDVAIEIEFTTPQQ